MLTLLPVLLTLSGRWIFWPQRPRFGTPEPTTTGLWARVGTRISHRPRAVWMITALVLVACAVGITQLSATGLTNAESFRGHPDSVVGESVLNAHNAGAAGAPVVVISKATKGDEVRTAFAGTAGIDPQSVSPPVVRGDYAYIQGTLTDPADSQAAYD